MNVNNGGITPYVKQIYHKAQFLKERGYSLTKIHKYTILYTCPEHCAISICYGFDDERPDVGIRFTGHLKVPEQYSVMWFVILKQLESGKGIRTLQMKEFTNKLEYIFWLLGELRENFEAVTNIKTCREVRAKLADAQYNVAGGYITRYADILKEKAKFLPKKGFYLEYQSEYSIDYKHRNLWCISLYYGRYTDFPEIFIEYKPNTNNRQYFELSSFRRVKDLEKEGEKHLYPNPKDKLAYLFSLIDFLEKNLKEVTNLKLCFRLKKRVNMLANQEWQSHLIGEKFDCNRQNICLHLKPIFMHEIQLGNNVSEVLEGWFMAKLAIGMGKKLDIKYVKQVVDVNMHLQLWENHDNNPLFAKGVFCDKCKQLIASSR